jgi:hypothetical protein
MEGNECLPSGIGIAGKIRELRPTAVRALFGRK